MKYGVFNPKTGTHSFTENKAAAKVWHNFKVSQWVEENSKEFVVKGQYLYINGWMEYFYCAYTFMCGKLGIPAVAIDDIQDTDALNLFYTHTVYNLDAPGIWSRTFAYYRNDSLWHIKVRNGEVTDWYIRLGKVNEVQHEWVSFDLNTGDPIEVYDLDNGSIVHGRVTDHIANASFNVDIVANRWVVMTGVLTKTSLIDPDAPAVITTFASYDEIPSEYKTELSSWSDKDTIISWANKSYGRIVEYKENIYRDKLEWPEGIIDAAKTSAKAEALKNITCVEIHIDDNGNETWGPTDFS